MGNKPSRIDKQSIDLHNEITAKSKLKIVLFGSNIGKSQWFNSRTDDEFLSKIETFITFKIESFTIGDKLPDIKAVIYDTPRNSIYFNDTLQYIPSADGLILTYNVHDIESLHHLEECIKKIKQTIHKHTACLLLGIEESVHDNCSTAKSTNCVDDAQLFAIKHNLFHLEIDIIQNIEAKQPYLYLLRKILNQKVKDLRPSTVALNKKPDPYLMPYSFRKFASEKKREYEYELQEDDFSTSATNELLSNTVLSPSRSRSMSMSLFCIINIALPALDSMQSIDEVLSDETPRESVDIGQFLSLYEIVELVAKARGTQHQNILLNTYTLFTTREQLLDVIFKRLLDISGDNARQIKIISLLKTWLKTEDGNSEELAPFALHFCKQLVVYTQNDIFLQKLSKPLLAQVSNFSMQSEEIYQEEAFAEAPSSKIPKVKSAKLLHLYMLDPAEVARQICLNEYDIFKKIKPEEFLKQSCSKKKDVELKVTNEESKLSEEVLLKQAAEMKRIQMKNKERASSQPNIDKMRDWFNGLSVWTQTEILSEMDLHQRCKIVSNLLDICRQLEKYNNISSLCAIRAGLCSVSIHRLRKTWQNIPKKAKETRTALDELFKLGNGQKNLRDRISIISQPAIPHLGLFLADIVFIHDGNDTFAKDEDAKINWEKMRLLADRIAWISMFQQSPFVFKPVPIISQYLESKMKMVPEDFLYKLSCAVEPPTKRK